MSALIKEQVSALADHIAITDIDWQQVEDSLNATGYAIIPALLSQDACEDMIQRYEQPGLFRSRVVMENHGYGQGEYQYFAYPLPTEVQALRSSLYAPLAAIGNRWQELLGIESRYPEAHDTYLQQCHTAGQLRPTPLLLRYRKGDYNCLHQDLYGEHVFPLQLAVLLSAPDHDFTGGEFVLTEQRPRMQSRASVVPLQQGDAVIFAVSTRPAQGTRGFHRVNMRHGVSELRSGQRYTLGIIFHDAQ